MSIETVAVVGRLPTKREAERVVDAMVTALESTPLNNPQMDGFTLKLSSLGKFSVRHKAGILRRIPLTGETILTKHRIKTKQFRDSMP